MRKVCLILVGLLALILIPAPAPAADHGSRPIVLWTSQHEPHKLAAIRYLTTAFTALAGGPKVEVVGFDEDMFFGLLDAALQGGRLPDVIEAPRLILADLRRRGLIDGEAVDEAIRRIGEDAFAPGTLAAARAPDGGGRFAVPMHAWVQGIWYRRDWFEATGLPPPDSLDRLRIAAGHFHRPGTGGGDGRYGIVLGTGADTYTEQGFLQIAAACGADLYQPEALSPEELRRIEEGLARYRDLAQFAPPGPVTWRDHELFLRGKAAMVVYSSFFIDTMMAAVRAAKRPGDPPTGAGVQSAPPSADQVGVVTCLRGPNIESCASYGEMTGLAALRGGSFTDRERLAELMAFLFAEDAYAAWLHASPGGMLPVLQTRALSDGFFLDLNRVYMGYGRSRVRALLEDYRFASAFRAAPHIAARARAEGVVSRTVAAVADGRLSPAAGARDIASSLARLGAAAPH